MGSTISTLLQWATAELDRVSESPRLDAEILLAHCLERDRAYLIEDRGDRQIIINREQLKQSLPI